MNTNLVEIHATAIVEDGAKIAEGCRIGPYCVIGAGVELGEDCVLDHHVSITGPTKIGRGNRFYPFAAIGGQTQDLKYSEEPTYLEIGENNCFREFVTVHRATTVGGKTIIGNHGNFLAYSHIAHDCVVGDHVIFSNNGTIAGHVIVEDYVIIGGLTAVHQFCRLGKHSITGGCSKIVQDVPSYMIADGNPAEVRGVNKVGLERHGMEKEDLQQLKEAYRFLYRSNLNIQQAIQAIREKCTGEAIQTLVQFIEGSQRGIIR